VKTRNPCDPVARPSAWARLLAVLAALLPPFTTAAADPLRIVCATTDLGAIARAVAGPEASVEVVARPDRDPHSLEVRPSTMRLVARADTYLAVGLSLDLWSEDIVRGSRNRDLVVIDCSSAVSPLEVPVGKVDASQGDVHPKGNPHYWTDPENGAAVARFLADRLAALRPADAQAFHRNADAFAAEIERRVPGWRERLSGRAFVEYHRSWIYLATRFGMDIAGQVEPLPGIPPGARHLAALAALIRARGVPVVVRDPYHPPDPVRFLARETGASGAVLPTACDEPTPASYFAHFDQVADVLGAPRTGSGG
jgi:zinc/manganese transport system substrate-binding protein